MFEKSLQIYLPVHSSTNLCSSVTFSFIRSNSFTCQPVHSSTHLCSSVTLSFITSNSSTRQPVYLSTYITLSFIRGNSSTRLLTCVLLLPCLLLETTRSLVHLVHSSTHITTYIFLGIGFFVLYLCIVIRNEGMTNGVLMKQISKFAI